MKTVLGFYVEMVRKKIIWLNNIAVLVRAWILESERSRLHFEQLCDFGKII